MGLRGCATKKNHGGVSILIDPLQSNAIHALAVQLIISILITDLIADQLEMTLLNHQHY
jgi:hypothetical protein